MNEHVCKVLFDDKINVEMKYMLGNLHNKPKVYTQLVKHAINISCFHLLPEYK